MKQKGNLCYTAAFLVICLFFSLVALQWEIRHRLRFRRTIRLRRLESQEIQSALNDFFLLQSCQDPYVENFLEKHPCFAPLNRLWLVNSSTFWGKCFCKELKRRGLKAPELVDPHEDAAGEIIAELKERSKAKTLLYEADSLLGGFFGVFLEVRSLEFFLAWGEATRLPLLGPVLKKLFNTFCLFFTGILVPCQSSLEGRPAIMPYDNIKTLINRAKVARLQPCSCKTYFLPDHTLPRDSCMGFSYVEDFADLAKCDHHAGYTVKEEILAKLQECEELGMVHQIMTVSKPTGSKGYVLCNCAADSCFPLVLYREYGISMVRGSGLIVKIIKPESCTSCQKCEKRCMFDACYSEGKSPAVREDKCLGCGLCVTTCPPQIRQMVKVD